MNMLPPEPGIPHSYVYYYIPHLRSMNAIYTSLSHKVTIPGFVDQFRGGHMRRMDP
jgi:hypothetical protein